METLALQPARRNASPPAKFSLTWNSGLDEEVKRRFWEDLDEMVRDIRYTEKLFIGGDFNGHTGATSGGRGANSSFPKKREHLVTFRSSVAEIQIDYLLCRKSYRGLCMDCKVILSENLSILHRLFVMDFEITRKRRKRAMYSQHRIKWEPSLKLKHRNWGSSC
nr:uncharacterized protein LOC104098695 [Nicotiana tomentosiformis]